MGASFRNIGEIKELAGCDRLTISPALLAELDAEVDPSSSLTRRLSVEDAKDHDIPEVPVVDEATFRWELNEDPMATDKLADGIRRFTADLRTLEDFIRTKLA